MIQFNSLHYEMLELLLRLKDGTSGKVILNPLGNASAIQQQFSAENGYFRWVRIPLQKETCYEIAFENMQISTAYLSGCTDILSQGIAFLQLDDTENGTVQTLDKNNLSASYNQPYREQYHFAPFVNWCNDPNGLCFYQGYYHLFYQANPFEQKWGNMYWGHAASRDLIHWVHLPYAFEPQEELWTNPKILGGAFSGCAVPLEKETRLFLTRSAETIEGKVSRQYQTMSKSSDMVHFSKEKTVIPEAPQGVSKDFRDPKVFRMNEKWYMVLGCGYKGGSAVLLYESDDLENWRYLHPVIHETNPEIRAIECPDCFEVDGKYVITACWMCHTDEHGRYQMTRYYIGHFEGTEFVIENSGWLDFGGNYYAPQSFEKDGERIAVIWVSDFLGEHRVAEHGAYGSYTIPRILRVKNSKLYMEPVPQIYSLFDQLLIDAQKTNINLTTVSGNSYYCNIKFHSDTDFNILLGRDGKNEIHFERMDGKSRIRTYGVKSEGIDYVCEAESITELDLFVDRRTVEVFVNHSEEAGTKIFYTESTDGVFQADFSKPDTVEHIALHTMKSIW